MKKRLIFAVIAAMFAMVMACGGGDDGGAVAGKTGVLPVLDTTTPATLMGSDRLKDFSKSIIPLRLYLYLMYLKCLISKGISS
jgi:hypothetical protein